MSQGPASRYWSCRTRGQRRYWDWPARGRDFVSLVGGLGIHICPLSTDLFLPRWLLPVEPFLRRFPTSSPLSGALRLVVVAIVEWRSVGQVVYVDGYVDVCMRVYMPSSG